MVRRIRIYQVDAFTKDVFSGNPAGVVPNAKGLSNDEMQLIAREMNNSETAFILPAPENDRVGRRVTPAAYPIIEAI